MKVKKKVLLDISQEIKKVNRNKKDEGYWCHNEWHSYKPTITDQEIVDIICTKLNITLEDDDDSKEDVSLSS